MNLFTKEPGKGKKNKSLLHLLLKQRASIFLSFILAGAALARDQIRVVGSSALFPFTTAAAENFKGLSAFKAPVIESTGTGAGFKLYCSGVGNNHPDIVAASRRMTDEELKLCKKNNVKDSFELKIGYDGIVIAQSTQGEKISLTRKQLYLALARDIIVNGKITPNPHHHWHEIDKKFPPLKIRIYGPPPTSGTRDAIIDLVIEPGCKEAYPDHKLIEAYPEICTTIREDEAYIDTGANENLIIQKINISPETMGILSYSFLEQNQDQLQAALIEGVSPTFATIKEGLYVISRPLYLYIKRDHFKLVPTIRNYIQEFTSTRAMGQGGYLCEKGLIPLDPEERTAISKAF